MGPEGRLLKIAKSQHFVFTHRQARGVGFSPSSIRRHVDDGRWRRLHRGVYSFAATPVGWEQRVAASCLACGADATASHSSAEVVWRFASVLDLPHVSVPAASYRSHPGIEVHRRQRLDAVGSDGFRVTNPMRTLLDLAPMRPEEIVERYVDDAHRRGLIAIRRLQSYLAEPDIMSRSGAKLLRELLRYRDPDVPIDSVLETDFFRVLRLAGLPLPVPQHPVMTRDGEKFIDFAYPDLGLAIELDGYADRANRFAFDRDRARQNVLEELGWRFRRFTWTQVREQPSGVACTVGLALGLRPVRWKPVR